MCESCTVEGSKMGLIRDKYNENRAIVVIKITSIYDQTHHVFGDTFLPKESKEHSLQ